MAGDLEALQASRLRREAVPSTKHGLRFSKWGILIDPSDWKDHCSGENGAERYRLPEGCSRPGVYEFGVAPALPNNGNKLDEASVIPVYVGGSGNVRARLQKYGRDGAHLERGSSASAPRGSHHRRAGPRLFTEIFRRGYSIVVRWAPVGSREEAERKEAELLNKYDYAWNQRGNGPSRRDSILQGLDGVASISVQDLGDEDEICEMMRDCSLQRDGSRQVSGYLEIIESEDSEHDSSPDDHDDDRDNNPYSDEDDDDDDNDDDDDDVHDDDPEIIESEDLEHDSSLDDHDDDEDSPSPDEDDDEDDDSDNDDDEDAVDRLSPDNDDDNDNEDYYYDYGYDYDYEYGDDSSS